MKVLLAFTLILGLAAKPRDTKPPVTFDPATINNPNQPDAESGAKGSGVARAQILLARANFSCGEIDGYYGSNLQKALAAYQEDRHLAAATGRLDAATWTALNADSAPALISYTTTAEDVSGPFVTIPADVQAQAELPAMGYRSALEALSERFHVSPAMLRALNPSANFANAGQALLVPNVLVLPPGRAARVEVRKSENSVRAYDAEGKLLAFYVATAGSKHDPLPIGEWKINGVGRNPRFHYNPNLFWDAKPGDSKTVLQPGPNNPVGPVWIDLSYEHTGIHGTPEPSRIGHAFSHGCIRLTNWDALQLAGMVRPGTPATLKE